MIGAIKESSLELLKDKFKNDETIIYVCKDKVCDLPTRNVHEAINQINSR